ncbi:MAG: hypothetical protein R2834_01380 [Rhodothermales bacterium]
MRTPIEAGALALLAVSLSFQLPAASVAQPNPLPFDDWDTLLATLPPDETEAEHLLLSWQRLLEQPLVLHRAGADEVDQLPYLSLAQQTALAARLRKGPALTSLDELLLVPGFDDATIDRLRPFVATASPDPAPTRWRGPIRVEWLQRASRDLTLRRGYRATETGSVPFAGSPDAVYTRFRIDRGALSLRGAGEKDAGEAFRWAPGARQYGFDHVSGSLAYAGPRALRRLVLGDYLVQTGSGLLLGPPYRSLAGAAPARDPVASESGLKPYGSAGESAFYRGVGVELHPGGGTRLLLFASQRAVSASVDSLFVDEALRPTLRSIDRTGLHRTAGERARRGSAGQIVAGGRWMIERGGLRLGMLAYQSRLTLPLEPGPALHQIYAVRGRIQRGAGVYGRFALPSGNVFLEAGTTGASAYGLLAGVQVRLAPRIEALWLARRYPPAFTPTLGNAFRASGTMAQNERGVYMALQIALSPALDVSTYLDTASHPWVGATVPLPAREQAFSVRLSHRPHPFLASYIQFRTTRGETGADHVDGLGRLIDGLSDERRSVLRVDVRYTHSRKVQLGVRGERIRSRTPGASRAHEGFLLYSDVRWSPSDRTRLVARWASFSSSSADTTPFAYEDDVYSRFSVTQYAGVGDRFYILFSRRLGPVLSIDFKYEQSSYPTMRRTGSGPDQFEGLLARAVRVQLRLKR